MENVGTKVRKLREELGMTSTELGRKVGISQAQISRLEAGRQGWRSHTLEKTAKALGVTVGFLYSHKGSYAEMATLLKQRPALKKILRSPVLSELALQIAKLKSANPKAFRGVKAVIEQLTK